MVCDVAFVGRFPALPQVSDFFGAAIIIMSDTRSPLRIFYLEDNPLIIFHVEYMIEDLGHIFAGSLGSFCELKAAIDELEIDCALIDVDLSDGPTGPAAAEWLLQRVIPSIFVTGQEQTAAQFDSISLGTVGKPLTLPVLPKSWTCSFSFGTRDAK